MLSDSIELNLPNHVIDNNINQLSNYVALISSVENQAFREIARVQSNDRIAEIRYEDQIEEDELNRPQTDRDISPYLEGDSEIDYEEDP